MFEMKREQQSAVDYMLSCFKELLLRGEYKPGDLLPNENVLAESMGVSRGTIREGMKILSAFGIVEILRGNGSYVSASIGDSLMDPFLLSLLMSKHDFYEMSELREMIELKVVKLALKNASKEDIGKIGDAVFEMKENIKNQKNGIEISPKEWSQVDISFHHALGKATKNSLIEKLYKFILRFFAPSIEHTYISAHNAGIAIKVHEDIYNALYIRDEDKLMAATEASIKQWEETEKINKEDLKVN